MSRTRRLRSSRTAAVIAGAILTGAVLAGCGTGQQAQTAIQQSAVNGTSARQGTIVILNARVAYPSQPAGGDALYQRGGTASLQLTMVNEGATPDRLVRVSSPAAGSTTITGDPTLTENLALVAGGVSGTSTPSGTRPLTVTLAGLTEPVRSGVAVPVTFTFERAGSVTVRVPTGTPAEGSREPERADSEAEGGARPAPPASELRPVAPEGSAPSPAPAPEGGR